MFMILYSSNRLHYCNLEHCAHYVVFMFCKFIFLNFLLYLFFGKIWAGKVEFFTWKLVQKISWGCDYKDTVEGLEAKCITALSASYSYVFIVAKSIDWSNQENVE